MSTYRCPGCELCGPALTRAVGDALISPRPIGPARPPALTTEMLDETLRAVYGDSGRGYEPDPPVVVVDPVAREIVAALYGEEFAGELERTLTGYLINELAEETP